MKELDKHLRLFDLTRNATAEEVKTAYRRLVREWHPDRHVDDEGLRRVAEERIKDINVAYNFLEDWCNRRKPGAREDEDDIERETIDWNPVDKETISVNLPPDLVFPLVYEAFKDLKLVDILWSTVDHALQGILHDRAHPARSRQAQVSLQERGRLTRVTYTFQFLHQSDNIKIGFVDGIDLLTPLRRATGGEFLPVARRHRLKTDFFRQFQLHEATWSEIKKKKVLCDQGDDWLELQGLSMNQILNLVFKALRKVNAGTIRWNTMDGAMQGVTGWSIRSCGQRLTAKVTGTAPRFRLELSSATLAYGGQTKILSDLGRGAEELRALLAALLDQVA